MADVTVPKCSDPIPAAPLTSREGPSGVSCGRSAKVRAGSSSPTPLAALARAPAVRRGPQLPAVGPADHTSHDTALTGPSFTPRPSLPLFSSSQSHFQTPVGLQQDCNPAPIPRQAKNRAVHRVGQGKTRHHETDGSGTITIATPVATAAPSTREHLQDTRRTSTGLAGIRSTARAWNSWALEEAAQMTKGMDLNSSGPDLAFSHRVHS
ncbi:hypothetical protein CPLU01_06685 [Colletotrichum plurivorum]|uniref:Uncharacterized protein n=1 Tax=Colletotrichum plurivorum TaxID=2175906 RepID=A0A8H6KH86_9PEZI|nr:hypothetical protein CPLU01_06685 [Colletotrichum plurivorum]